MIKIAMIGLRGIPAKSGGVENVVENLAPLLVKLGAEVTVYCRNPYCEERPVEWNGVRLRYLPTINKKHTEAFAHSAISTLDAMFRRYDIVHYHAMGNGLFSLFPRLTGKKTVVTLHGLDYEREKWGAIAKLYLKTCERLIGFFPNRTISCSKKIQKHYKDQYSKEIAFIPNGVPIVKPMPVKLLKKFGLGKGNYLLFLSRIVPEKGIHTLIEAFKELKTDVKLVIAGDATHTEEYEQQLRAQAEGDSRIIFTGPLYGDWKYEAFSNAKLFVLPSTIEGMPIVLLEAMSFGICPLVSDIRENLDVTEGLGFSFRAKDAESLRQVLSAALRNPKLGEEGRKCRKLVEERYRWPKIAEQTMQLYNEL